MTFIFNGSEEKTERLKLPSVQGLFHICYQNVPTSLTSQSLRVFDLMLWFCRTLPASFLIVTVVLSTYWEHFHIILKHQFKTTEQERSNLPLTQCYFLSLMLQNTTCSGCNQEWDHFCMGTYNIRKTRWKTMHMYRMKRQSLPQRPCKPRRDFHSRCYSEDDICNCEGNSHCSAGCLFSKV